MADGKLEEREVAVGESQVESAKTLELPKETLDYFRGDEIRARVFYEKYALRDDRGDMVEKTPIELWARLARELSSVEVTEEKRKEWEEKFKWLLGDFRFLPGGRIMFGAGQKRKNTLLNCYVIPIKDDSIESIFDWCKEAARTYSYGGGVGGDISLLRPKGAPVNNAAVHSTGSVSFMNIMSETTHVIGQSGRRGALMITIDINHPDVMDFIKVKRNLREVRYANVSVKVSDEFMHAVEEDRDFSLKFTNKKSLNIERTVKAKEVWNELIQSARDWAEPGIMFWDTIKRFSPSEYNGMEVISTNPCSEQPLQGYGACDLGSVNLSSFVIYPFTDKSAIDWQGLEMTVRYGTRFLDNVLTYNDDRHPLKAQSEAARNSRRIGLGITGLADMFAKMRIKYDSEEALSFADNLFDAIKRAAYDESTKIAKEKGPFPMFDAKKHLSMPFVKQLDEGIRKSIEDNGLRNVAILTIPPTGSISVLAGTSSGIEPIFALAYTRRSESLSKGTFKVYHPLVADFRSLTGVADEAQLPDYFIVAHKIKPEFRVSMQGIIQKHIDSAISSTVNLSEDTTPERVSEIYFKAWKAGCKSITVYREGSREGILITEEQEKQKEKQLHTNTAEQIIKRWERPQAMIGKTINMRAYQGSLYVTANFDGESIKEVFVDLGKGGTEEKSYCEALGRLISKYLQLGGDAKDVINSLKGIRSNNVIWANGLKLYSVPDSIAKALEIALGITGTQTGIKEFRIEAEGTSASPMEPKMSKCPSCNDISLVSENGCFICKACGYTKCE